MKQSLRVGFIGLGLMGKPMAEHILKAGFPLILYNRTPSKTFTLIKQGAEATKTPKDLAMKSDVIITMITGAEDVKQVLFGKDGVINGAAKGTIIIDMSTIGPTAAKEIAYTLDEKDIHFVDAPVTGSTPKAKTGELTIFVGAKPYVYDKVLPILQAMGTNIQHMGPVGMGQAIKLINNHIIAVSVVAAAEGMLLADAMGLSREKVLHVLQTSPASSGFMNLKMPNFVSNDYPLLFTAANMKKDLVLALAESKKTKARFPMLSEVVRLYEEAVAEALAQEDMSAVMKLMEDPTS